MEVDIY